MTRVRLVTLCLLLLLVVSSILTLTTGATPFLEVLEDLFHWFAGNGSGWNPLLDERLPRLIVLMATGASLAVAGAVTQALFHNPLASPSVLGISAGGSLSAMLALAAGWHIAHPYSVAIAACLGCLATLLLLYTVACTRPPISIHTVVLCGIALSTLLFAIRSSLTYALRDHWQLIQTLTEWESGSSYDRSWMHVHLQLPLALTGLFGCWHYREEINILALGEEEATNLGVSVSQVRLRLFICIALLTGGALAAMGIIAFFGLVLPHIIRFLTGPNMQRMLPLTAIGGASTLVTLDALLRLLGIRAFAIGNVSAVFGGLFFLILLINQLRTRTA